MWIATHPNRTTELHKRWHREAGIVQYGRHGYRGTVAKKVTDERSGRSRWKYDYCPHLHRKPSAAKKCGEREARRRNNIERRGGTF